MAAPAMASIKLKVKALQGFARPARQRQLATTDSEEEEEKGSSRSDLSFSLGSMSFGNFVQFDEQALRYLFAR